MYFFLDLQILGSLESYFEYISNEPYTKKLYFFAFSVFLIMASEMLFYGS